MNEHGASVVELTATSRGTGTNVDAEESGVTCKLDVDGEGGATKTSAPGLEGLSIPQVKLEVLSKEGASWLLFFVLIVILYGLVLVICLLATVFYNVGGISAYAVFLMQGLTSTIALVLIAFGLLAYPQRVMRIAFRKKSSLNVLPHQVLLIVLLFVMFFLPQTSIFGIISFWDRFATAAASEDFSNFYTRINPTEGIRSNSTLRTMFSILTIVFFWFWILNICYKFTVGIAQELEMRKPHDEDPKEADAMEYDEEPMEDVEAGGVIVTNKRFQARLNRANDLQQFVFNPTNAIKKTGKNVEHKVEKTVEENVNKIGCCSCYYLCCCFLCCSKAKCSSSVSKRGVIRRGVNMYFTFAIIFYVVLFGILSDIFEFAPSVIPFVGLITVFRVCADSDANGISYCNQEIHTRGFQRAFSVVCLFFYEFYLAWWMAHISTKCYDALAKVPYSLNRPNYLGFTTIQAFTLLIWFCIFMIAIPEISIPPTEYWINTYSIDNQTVTTTQDPLVFVGVTAGGIAYVCTSLLVNVWVILLCYLYLPSDADGFLGWFCSKQKQDDMATGHFEFLNGNEEHGEMTQEQIFEFLEEKPLTVATESQFGTLGIFPHHEDLLQDLAKSPVLCLETCVLLFNFAATVYKIGGTSPDATLEEKQKFIQDDRFTLLRHIINEETDTHCIICLAEDRVVVAFRGTVSEENVKTDLNYSLTRYEVAEKVEPVQQPSALHELNAKREPQVHTGFLKAYNSVREIIYEEIQQYIFERDDLNNPVSQIRTVMVTGHSLGAALSTICSFELAMKIREQLKFENPRTPVACCCVNFASPRVGNYSFAQRYKSYVQCRRLVVTADIVPKLPPSGIRSIFKGYHHVGTEVLLDIKGNLLVQPNVMESWMLHSLAKIKPELHFCTSYCLALILIAGRLNQDPRFWPVLINDMVKYRGSRISKIEPTILRPALGIIIGSEEVVFPWNGLEYRTIGTTTSDEEEEKQTLTIDEGTMTKEEDEESMTERKSSTDTMTDDEEEGELDNDEAQRGALLSKLCQAQTDENCPFEPDEIAILIKSLSTQ